MLLSEYESQDGNCFFKKTEDSFMCGKTPVKVCFNENGAELGEKLKNYFCSLKANG